MNPAIRLIWGALSTIQQLKSSSDQRGICRTVRIGRVNSRTDSYVRWTGATNISAYDLDDFRRSLSFPATGLAKQACC